MNRMKLVSMFLTIVFILGPCLGLAIHSAKTVDPSILRKLGESIPTPRRSSNLPQTTHELSNVISLQGPGTSGGGNGLEIEFKRIGLDLIEDLQKAQITELSHVLVSKLKETLVNSLIVETSKEIYVDNNLKDARNFPLLQGIEVNSQRWRNLRFSEKRQLTIHEVLGLMKIDDSHYLRSYYLEKLASMTSAESSELSRLIFSGEATISSAERHNLAPYQILREIKNDRQLNQYFNEVENDLAQFKRRQQEELLAAEAKTIQKLYFPPPMVVDAINRSRPSMDCRVTAVVHEDSLVITGEAGYESWDNSLRRNQWITQGNKFLTLKLPLKDYFMGRAYREMFPLQDWKGRNPMLIKFDEGHGQILIEEDGRLVTADVSDGRNYFRCGDFGFSTGVIR